MTDHEKEKLTLLMRELRQVAVRSGCWSDIWHVFNPIVNGFGLDGRVYDEPKDAA